MNGEQFQQDKRPKGFSWLMVEHKPKIWSAYKWHGGLTDAYKKGGNSVMKFSSTRTKPALQKWAHSLAGTLVSYLNEEDWDIAPAIQIP